MQKDSRSSNRRPRRRWVSESHSWVMSSSPQLSLLSGGGGVEERDGREAEVEEGRGNCGVSFPSSNEEEEGKTIKRELGWQKWRE